MIPGIVSRAGMRFLDHLLGRRVACAQCQTVTRNSYGLCEACIEERLHGTRRQASPRTLQAVLRITDPNLLRDLAEYGREVRRQHPDYESWASAMRKEFGPRVEPHLGRAWDEVRRAAPAAPPPFSNDPEEHPGRSASDTADRVLPIQASPRTQQALLRIIMTALMRSLTLLCLSAIAMLCLYVPWRVSYSGELAVFGSRDLGYGFLWNSPEALGPEALGRLPSVFGTVTVDLTRLTLSLLGGAAILALVLSLGWWMGAWRRGGSPAAGVAGKRNGLG